MLGKINKNETPKRCVKGWGALKRVCAKGARPLYLALYVPLKILVLKEESWKIEDVTHSVARKPILDKILP